MRRSTNSQMNHVVYAERRNIMQTESYLPVPDIDDPVAFRQRSLNDSNRMSKRPPKLYQKSHDISYNRSFNQSIPHEISFRQHSTVGSATVPSLSPINGRPNASRLNNSVYRADRAESYFDQCFDVLARIGEGSFGEVFKVRSKEDGRLYAIKKSKQLYRGETARQECINEVRHHEKFSEHEHCITLHKAWEQNDLLYMQLELCKSNLETLSMQSDKFPEARVWDILVDLLLALKELHDQNFIHLDIKLENIMISQDNVCKLGDFGLVMDLNQKKMTQREGDSRYIAPELLQGRFTKAADIFSLGITILELACNLDLPKNGHLWQKLRDGLLPDEFIRLLSVDMQNIIKSMLDPDPLKRPDVNALLRTKSIKKILARRKMMRPFHTIKKATKNIWSSMYSFRLYMYSWFTSIIAAFKLTRRRDHRKDSIAKTSTPQTVAAESSDDSFLQLEDSNIDFDDSPSNRSHSKSFVKPVEMQIVNSTPLNHYNSQGSYRRNRSELSRTSLAQHFSDHENVTNTSNSSTNWPSKKLFEFSEDSD